MPLLYKKRASIFDMLVALVMFPALMPLLLLGAFFKWLNKPRFPTTRA